MYTVALAESVWLAFVTVTACTPAAFGGEYSPFAVVVPDDAVPRAAPATFHMTLEPLLVNWCVCVNVSEVTRGAMVSPAACVAVPTRETRCGFPSALFAMLSAQTREPVLTGTKVTS